MIDFEATCEESHNFDYDNEIIEFPAVLLDGTTYTEVDVFHEYIRPVLNPKLTAFCMRLTGISQAQVDAADAFPAVLARFEAWLTARALPSPKRVVFVTDGPWDLRDFLRKQIDMSELKRPAYFDEWINLRRVRNLKTNLPIA